MRWVFYVISKGVHSVTSGRGCFHLARPWSVFVLRFVLVYILVHIIVLVRFVSVSRCQLIFISSWHSLLYVCVCDVRGLGGDMFRVLLIIVVLTVQYSLIISQSLDGATCIRRFTRCQ